MLMTKVVMAISIYMAPFINNSVPANCPAEVRLVIEINTAIHPGYPCCTTIIPKVKDTDKYPRQMGIPSRNPFVKVSFGGTESVDSDLCASFCKMPPPLQFFKIHDVLFYSFSSRCVYSNAQTASPISVQVTFLVPST